MFQREKKNDLPLPSALQCHQVCPPLSPDGQGYGRPLGHDTHGRLTLARSLLHPIYIYVCMCVYR